MDRSDIKPEQIVSSITTLLYHLLIVAVIALGTSVLIYVWLKINSERRRHQRNN